MKAYAPSLLYQGKALLERKTLLVEGARIKAVCDDAVAPGEARTERLDGILAPGYVDLQINGCGGTVFSEDLSLASVVTMRDVAAQHGVTSILPTLITATDDDIVTALEVVGRAMKEVPGVVGMHLEGPHISVEKRGTHAKELVRPLDRVGLERIRRAVRNGILKLLTVAPESVTNEQISLLAGTGLCISLGHTAASAEAILAAERSGARMLTHMFNGMPALVGRAPGPVGAGMASDSLLASIIVDGAHVDRTSVKAVFNAMGDRLLLISDTSASEEGGSGPFTFGGHACRIENGVVRNEEGGLAGAAMLLDRMVANTAEILGDAAQAIFMATELPARAIGMEGEIGSLAPGARADFILLDDKSLQVRQVWRGGEPIAGDAEPQQRLTPVG